MNVRSVLSQIAGNKLSGISEEGDEFVFRNYEILKDAKLFSALIPEELGGGGWTYNEMSNLLKELAKECSSTALAFSMHQHLVAANVWKYRKGQGAEELLKRIAATQLILVSTGAGDWLSSNGKMTRTTGGYRVSAKKHFASQAPVGNLLVTSACYTDPEKGPQVLHFSVPFSAEGVKVEDNWFAMGMRNTGSATVSLEDVFIPESSISLKRQQGEFHPFWNVVIAVAMPSIMSVYLGIAEEAARIALAYAKENINSVHAVLIGAMSNSLTTAQVMCSDMLRLNNNLEFQPIDEIGNEVLIRKTVVANSCLHVIQKAFEIVGGRSYLTSFGLEKMYRDMIAANFHPLPKKEQQAFTGNFLLRKQER